jgi:hypothetical protein
MRHRYLALVVVMAGLLSMMHGRVEGQAPPAQPPPPTPATAFKNITVLQDLTAVELSRVMEAYNAALGVDCTHCHVIGRGAGLSSAALDDKPQKNIARRMITMTRELKKSGVRVECVTCHAGHPVPPSVAPAMDPDHVREVVLFDEAERAMERQKSGVPQPPGAVEHTPERRALPPVAEVFAKYEQAIGGRAAIDALTSRVATGTIVHANGQKMTVELKQKAPDKTVTVTAAPGALQRTVINGAMHWRGNGANPNPIQAHHWPGLELEQRFFRTLRLAPQYTGAVVSPEPRKLDSRPVYVVKGAVTGTPFSDALFFDAETGLLLRRETSEQTSAGPVHVHTDFSDYRPVNGVRMPFVIRRVSFSSGVSVTTTTWSTMQFNVPVGDEQFERPATAYAPAP